MSQNPLHFLFDHAARFAVCLLLAIVDGQVRAQEPTGTHPQGSAPATWTGKKPAVTPLPMQPSAGSKSPDWKSLGTQERHALAPLAGSWEGLTPSQKRKWREVSRNFATLPAAEQEKMQHRMRQWAALSPQERAQARLNFGKAVEIARELTPAEKLARWQAYQALPPEQKRKLAEQARAKRQGAAPASQPVSTQKLAVVPPISTARATRVDEVPAESPEAAEGASTQ